MRKAIAILLFAVILLVADLMFWRPYTSVNVDSAQTSASVVAELAGKANPVAIFGLYNCRGWAGALVVESDGTVIGPLSLKPDETIALADKAGVTAQHRQHLFPAEGDCGHGPSDSPGYQQENPAAQEEKPAAPLTAPDGRQTI